MSGFTPGITPQPARRPAFNLVSSQLQNQSVPGFVPLPAPRPAGLHSPRDLFVSGLTGKSGAIPAVSLAAPPGEAHSATGTGYYPHNNRMEGGFKDMKGARLNTLQDFLAGKAPYVSIALDQNMYEHVIQARRNEYRKTGNPKLKKYLTMKPQVRYGDTFRIPELEQKYGRQIVFKAVDTGGAFTGKGFSRVDIANKTRKDTYDKTINGKLTLVKA